MENMGDINLETLNATFGEMIARAGNPKLALAEIGGIGVSEMKQNFIVGGRPEKWKQSKRVKKHGGQTLRMTGSLMNSTAFEVSSTGVAMGPTNNLPEAAKRILAYGKAFPWRKGQKRGGAFPGRDYTYLPPSALTTFGEVMQKFIVGE